MEKEDKLQDLSLEDSFTVLGLFPLCIVGPPGTKGRQALPGNALSLCLDMLRGKLLTKNETNPTQMFQRLHLILKVTPACLRLGSLEEQEEGWNKGPGTTLDLGSWSLSTDQ